MRHPVHIWHVMLWEFKNNKITRETAKKIFIVYGSGVITDHKIQNWFSKSHFDNMWLRDEPRPGCSSDLNQDPLREFMKCNPHKSTWEQVFDLDTSQSTATWNG